MRRDLREYQKRHPQDPLLVQMVENAIREIDWIEQFTKSGDGMKSQYHLGCRDTTGAACHCPHNRAGRKDPCGTGAGPCGHDHEGSCVECERCFALPTLISEISNFVAELEAKIDESEDLEHMPYFVDSARVKSTLLIDNAMALYCAKYMCYLGHLSRLVNEDQWEEEMIIKLKANPSLFVVDCDYAMKFLPLRHREDQSAFYGKKGHVLFGARVMWYDEIKGELKCYFSNQVSEDSEENCHTSIQQLTATLKVHSSRVDTGHHKAFHLRTDGAGHFSGIEFVGRLPYLERICGYRCLSHHKGEGGGGKCEVDGNFGNTKHAVDSKCTEMLGDADINTAYDLFVVMKSCEIKNTVISMVYSDTRYVSYMQ